MDGGNEDDGRLLKTWMLADDLSQFKAVHLRHAYIHQYDGDIGLKQLLKGFFGGRRLDEVLSQVGQNGFIGEQFARLIIDHQDVYFFVDAHHSVNAPYSFRRISPDLIPRPCTYLCSHIRNAESSCSVLTGLPRYSEAPASRHFSRSPFIAFAVSAMIGNRRNDGFCRMTCMVAYPSISGIMMSIKTMAPSGVDSSIEMASRPVPAVKTAIPRRSSTLLRAKMLRMSSSTTSTFFPTNASSERCSRSSIFCFSCGRSATPRCRKSAVSSSSRSGDSTPLTTTLRASVCRRASSSDDSSFPVNTTTGRSLSDSLSRRRSRTSKPDMSGRRRSSTTQSNGCSLSISSASLPLDATETSMSL